MKNNRSFKVTIIGAGSICFTREMIQDLFSVPEFKDGRMLLSFTDISEENLEMSVKLIQRDIDANNIPVEISYTTDRREALKDAKYIFCFIRQGGLEGYKEDIDIPLKYGVDQCVGDTLGPGGIMYGQRGIPEILAICKDIREVAHKDAMMLNYVNPNAMITWACNKYGKVPTIGLCHGVQNGVKLFSEVLEIPYEEIDYTCVGINHQTWYTKILHKGREIGYEELLNALESDEIVKEQEKVRIDILKRFGYFSTESNGHLSEYLPWYRKRPEEIKDWISMDNWINGETGGYYRHCFERRTWYQEDFPKWIKETPFKYPNENNGIEHASHIIEALETGRSYRGHFNVVNNGVIKNLPDDAIVEVPAFVDANGLQVPVYGELPLGCAAVCNASISVQRLAVEAAVHGDVNLLKQAMMMDPLTGAVLNPKEISQMTDEMLVVTKRWLPQYEEEIKRAEYRLANEELIKPRGCNSGCRKEIKTVEELKKSGDAAKYKLAAHNN